MKITLNDNESILLTDILTNDISYSPEAIASGLATLKEKVIVKIFHQLSKRNSMSLTKEQILQDSISDLRLELECNQKEVNKLKDELLLLLVHQKEPELDEYLEHFELFTKFAQELASYYKSELSIKHYLKYVEQIAKADTLDQLPKSFTDLI